MPAAANPVSGALLVYEHAHLLLDRSLHLCPDGLVLQKAAHRLVNDGTPVLRRVLFQALGQRLPYVREREVGMGYLDHAGGDLGHMQQSGNGGLHLALDVRCLGAFYLLGQRRIRGQHLADGARLGQRAFNVGY